MIHVIIVEKVFLGDNLMKEKFFFLWDVNKA